MGSSSDTPATARRYLTAGTAATEAASTDVIQMGEILSADPRRTIRGFVPDKKFDVPAPMLAFDGPYEDDEDRLNKVKKYWRVHDKERMLREAHYKELLDAEVQAAERRKADENTQALEKAKEEAAAWEKEKEKEKEKVLETAAWNKKKTIELEKDSEAGPSGVNKGKTREVPKTPRKVTPKKSLTEVWLGSEGEEDEEKLQCVYCMKKKITCVPQAGKKVCVTCGWRKMKCEFFDKSTFQWASELHGRSSNSCRPVGSPCDLTPHSSLCFSAVSLLTILSIHSQPQSV
ncbi:hypothetical protein M422DRAFT_252186 [Sphaerobolus stellatus SS14]|uniref:Zn(2)-C6 fungal-type domain-containing protein n=1 Tax=Sphaerobolus stellatus (strain SS14) TaxID=990650 RepID=A0A0C9UNI1_SPHS4|nr:hypothetical protein M422DRAFT_252186 [Sphaerobolus stellatus SS14]